MTDTPIKTGYKNPPAEHQFKKGLSGNPKGRPRRIKSANKILAEEMDKLIPVTENGKKVWKSKREAFIISLVNNAIQSDRNARAMLLKILALETPKDPFVPNSDDEAILAEFLKGQKPDLEPDKYE